MSGDIIFYLLNAWDNCLTELPLANIERAITHLVLNVIKEEKRIPTNPIFKFCVLKRFNLIQLEL